MTPLSGELRAATKQLHVEAERAGVMGLLLKGRLTREPYVALLGALHAIYSALEDSLDRHAADPAVAPLRRPGLARRDALRHDLEALAGSGWRTTAAAHPLAQAYAAHLRALGDAAPSRLLAHAWLRYLGDLNGGQVLKRIVRESLAIPAEASTFYDFPGIGDPHAAAAAWRAALDDVPLAAGEREAIVAEACDGFRRHIALFEALADIAPAAGAPAPAAS